jgi:hypothetical protein
LFTSTRTRWHEAAPDNATRVLRLALGKPAFRWDTDGEALLRTKKSAWYANKHLLHVAVIGDRLAQRLRTTGV